MGKLVALAMPPSRQFIDELCRAWEAGDAVLPIDLRLPPRARERLLTAMGAGVVVDQGGERHSREGWPTEDGDALVVATSGTTSGPKGVVLTHEAVAASARITSSRLGVTKADRWLCCLPVAHIGGLAVITRALLTGVDLLAIPAFDPIEVETCAREGATIVSLVPAAFPRIDSALFRLILLGGSVPPPNLPANVVTTYGMTETGSGICYDGRPLDGVQIKTDVTGQILVSSPTLLRCYRDRVDPKTSDGWLPTGDAGEFDADGRLVVHGRIEGMIITGGQKVWPSAVESVLKAHPEISEALVYGRLDPDFGHRVVATVEILHSAGKVTASDLREYLADELPAYAVPKEFNIVSQLERTASGKVRRP